MTISVDGQQLAFVEGDSVAIAIVRNGQHPLHGGTLCLAGDCGNCVAEVDGTAFVRTCQVQAHDMTMVKRHPAVGGPNIAQLDTTETRQQFDHIPVRRETADLVVIGAGDSGGAAAAVEGDDAGRLVTILDTRDGNEVVGVYGGPTVVVRTVTGMRHIRANDVIIATGAAELHPVCEGSMLAGIYTPAAARKLKEASVDLGNLVAIGGTGIDMPGRHVDGTVVAFIGEGRVIAVVTEDADGNQDAHPCDSVVVGVGFSPRDLLLRMTQDEHVTVVGPAAQKFALPACPDRGTVCPCSKTTVDDINMVWDKGFNQLELLKRSSLAGTGTCQGSVCGPYLRSYVAERSGETPEMFTARPASRQITLAEAGAGVHPEPFRRTALHEENTLAGANLDRFGNWWRPWNYGDHEGEYHAVRNAVSLGDVSTLGKMIVDGPDSVELLERLYPTTIADIKPGRSRYVLLLNERGHIIDDGMVCRESDTRFVLTFTSGGAANAEAFVRDWIETWNLNVNILDRTMSLAAINVTGPRAGELLQRVGVENPPKFLQHQHGPVAGIACHIMRLSFTGEASFELHHAVDRSAELWRALMAAGQDMGIRPHGLQTLFGLRLEKGHIIVGMDTEMDTTPRRVNMDWAVKMSKPNFIGRAALERTAKLPDQRRLYGFEMEGEAPVEGTPILVDGQIHGHVSSTFTSPTLGKAIMLGWLKRGASLDGEAITHVEIGGRPATLVEPPFFDHEGARARA
jgi:glycine cleavage system T protein